MQKTLKTIDGVNKFVGWILALLLAIMSIMILLQIFTRFIINYPLHWTEETARYLMIYLVFMGAALALRHHRLIAIELFPQSLNETGRKVLTIILMTITIVFSMILLQQGIKILNTVQLQTSAGLGISMAIPYAAIPIGALLLIMNSIAVILENFIGKDSLESEDIQ